ncbi:MAG: SDR family oxidoreductase [Parachlamydiaceae bacterium]|nr:SDR family oxidoreductase [Parachlamydiaceae bacterium]
MRLVGKKVIVTGANRSIGKAIALLFAKEGAELVISYRSDKKGAEEVVSCIQKTKGVAYALYADFSTYEGIEQFYRESIDVLGHVDILVNNAGGYNTLGFFDLKPQDFEQLLQVTLMTPFFLSQLVAKGMVEKQTGGNIINISSISGTRPTLNRVAHASGKAALNMLTQTMALELAQHRIRVNAIAPGYTPYEESSELDPSIKDIPLGRAGLPTDQASTALFLATEESSWMTGQILTVDGGHSIALSIKKES